jgi:hypothetical protein
LKSLVFLMPLAAAAALGLLAWRYPISAPSDASAPQGRQEDPLAEDPPGTQASATRAVDFASQVLPVLSDNCYFCHGPDESERGGELRLDQREAALASGAIVPGRPQDSELWKRITSSNPKQRMPPKESHKSLSEEQKQLLHDWILQGAEYSEHWAFVKPERPARPELPPDLAERAKNDIDRFVFAKAHELGLTPQPQASWPRLLRRVSLDLTGLPPEPARLEELLREGPSDAAYASYVEELLASPDYAEHMTSWWLDKARFADTTGYEADRHRPMWGYRDWVIRAFEADMPFDQFTSEQLAGDLLAGDQNKGPSKEQLIATAFHRNTMTNNEGGTDDEEYRVAAVLDRTNTTMSVWMGLTWGCAQCHSHKYDPITHTEYYETLAFFNRSADADRMDEAPTLLVETERGKHRLPIMQELPAEKSRETYVFAKGSFLSPERERGPVQPGTPEFLHAFPKDAPRNRLGLSEWLVHPDNPLTARVQVNRLWARLMGQPIVASQEDFGLQSTQPTNRALIDYLAVRWQHELDWRIKPLLREIAMSHTYRQSSKATEQALELDPYNRFYARGAKFRLEAEALRDQALAVGGLLSRKRFGPSVMPHQPPGIWQTIYNGARWKQSPGEDAYRRSVYTYIKRTSAYPQALNFDASSRESCTIARMRTNTPLQALTTLNDRVFVDAARGLARRGIKSGADATERLRFMFARALCRAPNEAELARLRSLFDAELQHYARHQEDARDFARLDSPLHDALPQDSSSIPTLAALTACANVILNLDEFVSRP